MKGLDTHVLLPYLTQDEAGGDFADRLIGWRNRKAGCETTFTFDRDLKASDRFKVL